MPRRRARTIGAVPPASPIRGSRKMSASPPVEVDPHDDVPTLRPPDVERGERAKRKAPVSDLPLFADLAESETAADSPQSADRAEDDRVTQFPGLRL